MTAADDEDARRAGGPARSRCFVRLIREASDPALIPASAAGWSASWPPASMPGRSASRRVSRPSLDRWIRAWRSGGFDALAPPARQVTPRTPAEVLELAAALKGENPDRTAAQVSTGPAGQRRVVTVGADPAAPLRAAGAGHPARTAARRRRSAGSRRPAPTRCGPATRCTGP